MPILCAYALILLLASRVYNCFKEKRGIAGDISTLAGVQVPQFITTSLALQQPLDTVLTLALSLQVPIGYFMPFWAFPKPTTHTLKRWSLPKSKIKRNFWFFWRVRPFSFVDLCPAILKSPSQRRLF
jgi:hypothetical protein